MDVQERIARLKQERNAVVLAHFYVDGAVQDIADYVGDSFNLSKVAAQVDADVIVFAGVQFMGESAKLLSPDKTVYLPEPAADCPMAHMVTAEAIAEVKAAHPDAAVVCYVNSTAGTKALSDVCVTSSNALNVVRSLPNEHILFIPDQHLGSWIAEQLPEKTFHFVDGCCPIHDAITLEAVEALAKEYPDAPVLVHPECLPEVVECADYVGSTSGIIDAVTASDAADFIIGTVEGIGHAILKKEENAGKALHFPVPVPTCTDMDLITVEKVAAALEGRIPEVPEADPAIAEAARRSLDRMLELA